MPISFYTLPIDLKPLLAIRYISLHIAVLLKVLARRECGHSQG